MNGPTECPSQCSISAGYKHENGGRIWFMVPGESKCWIITLIALFIIIITGNAESLAKGCGQAKIQHSKMKMVFDDDVDIDTTYGCTPNFGAGKTLKLVVNSASESCKLQLVSWYYKKAIKNFILYLFLDQRQNQTTTGFRNFTSQWNSRCRTRFLGMARHCNLHPLVDPHPLSCVSLNILWF